MMTIFRLGGWVGGRVVGDLESEANLNSSFSFSWSLSWAWQKLSIWILSVAKRPSAKQILTFKHHYILCTLVHILKNFWNVCRQINHMKNIVFWGIANMSVKLTQVFPIKEIQIVCQVFGANISMKVQLSKKISIGRKKVFGTSSWCSIRLGQARQVS